MKVMRGLIDKNNFYLEEAAVSPKDRTKNKK